MTLSSLLRGRRLWLIGAITVCALSIAGYCLVGTSDHPGARPLPEEAPAAQVRQFCGTVCHAYPPPDTFPRNLWRKEVKQAYDLFRASPLQVDFPSMESVALYYEKRAPLELALLPASTTAAPPIRFARSGYDFPGRRASPAVTHVNLVALFDDKKRDVLVCDSRAGMVLAFKAYTEPPSWTVLGKVPHPAHAEVVDLDGDGIKDILVADLGQFSPTDDRVGSVMWLRGQRDGKFVAQPLLEGVGRVADVQAADFDGDGRLDLVVAVFGWRNTGEIILLHNQTTDWSRPHFVPTIIDDRHGTIHVPVADLNGDGRPDFVALISQEHEAIVAFLNDGKGGFHKQTIYQAPHPAYGSSGIQLVDLNQDGKLDVLYTNGDVLDPPYLLKPYHSIQWLENRGRFPFVHHHLTSLYGAHRAVAADMDGDGDLDIVAVAFLPPPELFPPRRDRQLDSVILLEQTAPGRFERYALEVDRCDHMTCAVGDLFGDARAHLVTGNFCLTPDYRLGQALVIHKNLGARVR